MYCNSCGGLLGRDCFNPVECAEISSRNYYDSYYEVIIIEVLEQSILTIIEANLRLEYNV